MVVSGRLAGCLTILLRWLVKRPRGQLLLSMGWAGGIEWGDSFEVVSCSCVNSACPFKRNWPLMDAYATCPACGEKTRETTLETNAGKGDLAAAESARKHYEFEKWADARDAQEAEALAAALRNDPWSVLAPK